MILGPADRKHRIYIYPNYPMQPSAAKRAERRLQCATRAVPLEHLTLLMDTSDLGRDLEEWADTLDLLNPVLFRIQAAGIVPFPRSTLFPSISTWYPPWSRLESVIYEGGRSLFVDRRANPTTQKGGELLFAPLGERLRLDTWSGEDGDGWVKKRWGSNKTLTIALTENRLEGTVMAVRISSAA